MLIANKDLRERVCAYEGTAEAEKIPQKQRIYLKTEEARNLGYTLHPSCDIIRQAYEKDEGRIDELCKKKGLTITFSFDRLLVKSPLGQWMIIVAGKDRNFFLYHKNSPKCQDREDTRIPGYHWHNKRCEGLYGYLYEIARHDDWRMANEIVHPFKEKENMHKYGSKAYKKHERAEKTRREKYGVRVTLSLLDAIAEQNRRASLG